MCLEKISIKNVRRGVAFHVMNISATREVVIVLVTQFSLQLVFWQTYVISPQVCDICILTSNLLD